MPWHVGQTYKANPQYFRETSVQRYACDVGMPIGTDILAMRAGEVVRVEESFFDGDNVFGHENHVLVRHEDGTVARYVHLTNRGALVQVGDLVQQAQPIGLSGRAGLKRVALRPVSTFADIPPEARLLVDCAGAHMSPTTMNGAAGTSRAP